jgi:hypothetical protein
MDSTITWYNRNTRAALWILSCFPIIKNTNGKI